MTCPAVLIYAINLAVVTLLVHTADFFTRMQVGAWKLETEALYLMGGIIIMLLGAGRGWRTTIAKITILFNIFVVRAYFYMRQGVNNTYKRCAILNGSF